MSRHDNIEANNYRRREKFIKGRINMTHTPVMRSLMRIMQLARRENLKTLGAAAPRSRNQLNASRRQFLKLTACAGAVGLVPGALPRHAWASGDRYPSIAIVGAGLAGLNAAYQLQKAGVQADVYEANNRVGGRVYSRSDLVGPGVVTEMGAEFINTDHADMLALAEEFGLTLFDRRADVAALSVPTSAYYFNGKAWSEAELAVLLQPLVEQISHDATLLDRNWSRYAPKLDRNSVADYLDRYTSLIPQPFIRTLFENTIRTEYGVEVAESSALQLLFLLPSVNGEAVELLGYSDETYTVEGGNGRIADSLAQALGDQIHLGMALTKLEKDRRDKYELTFANGAQVQADHVILAMPFSVLRQVVLNVPLPQTLRQFITEVNLGSNEKVQAGYAQRVWRQQGFSLEAWTDLGFSEVWDGAQRQPDHQDGVLTYFLGGDEVHQLSGVAGGSNTVGANFTHRLASYVPALESSATGKYMGTGWTQNPFSRGAYANFKPGQLTQFGNYFWIESDVPSEAQKVNVGRLVIAGEQVSDAYYGFMNGAAQTGRLAAGVVLEKLGKSTIASHAPSKQRVG
jgi:monoamine oxidase